MEGQFENRNLKLENCDIPPKKSYFPKTESPSHNALSANPSCQTGHLSALWHGDPAHRHLSGIPACQSITQPTLNRSHPSVPPGPRHGALPTMPSVLPPRAKASPNRPQTGLTPVFLPVFATLTLPTSTPEASWRGEGGFWPVFGTAPLPTGT